MALLIAHVGAVPESAEYLLMNTDEQEEREIFAAFEAGKLKSQNPSPETLAHHRAYARSTMTKDQRV